MAHYELFLAKEIASCSIHSWGQGSYMNTIVVMRCELSTYLVSIAEQRWNIDNVFTLGFANLSS